MLKFAPKSSPRWSQILENRALGLSWNTLGTLLAPRWRKSDHRSENNRKIYNFRVALGVQNEAKMERKSDKKLNDFLDQFRNDFFSILGRFLLKKPLQNRRF